VVYSETPGSRRFVLRRHRRIQGKGEEGACPPPLRDKKKGNRGKGRREKRREKEKRKREERKKKGKREERKKGKKSKREERKKKGKIRISKIWTPELGVCEGRLQREENSQGNSGYNYGTLPSSETSSHIRKSIRTRLQKLRYGRGNSVPHSVRMSCKQIYQGKIVRETAPPT